MAVVRLVFGFIIYISKGVLISVLTSAVLLFAGYSIVTRQFPPNFSDYEAKITEVQSSLKILKQYVAIHSEDQSTIPSAKISKRMPSVDEMIEINENRIKLGRDIAAVIAPDENESKVNEAEESKKEIQKLQGDIEFLKARVQGLEDRLSQ